MRWPECTHRPPVGKYSYALIAGACALFALLATVMLLTRRLDWYAPLGSPSQST